MIFFLNVNVVNANVLENIKISGNERISNETIKLFSKVSINETIDQNKLNEILKNLYETNFFSDVKLEIDDNILSIIVVENPIIEDISYEGISANKIVEALKENSLVVSRSSFNETILKKEKFRLNQILKDLGYYKSTIDILIKEEKNNLVKLTFKFNLGEKAKIKKIKFIGNKIFKDRKLRRIIASEEYKFWKFISGKKYLNENLVQFDTRLLKNFYKNNGYYNVVINSSFAKLINKDEFELIFNIDAKSKVYFGKMNLTLPIDFDKNNFLKIEKLFNKIQNKSYSINTINKILNEIDKITALEQYQFINASVEEEIVDDKINLNFKINETEKYYIQNQFLY